MALSDASRCPVCQSAVSVRLAWELTPKNSFGFLSYSIGVVCPGCETKLRIVQRRSVLAVALFTFSIFALIAALGRMHIVQPPLSYVFVAVLTLPLLFSSRVARRFVTLEVRVGNDTVDFPVERLKEEFLTETGDNLSDEELQGSGRICPKCGETTSTRFQICLHCGQYDPNAT